MPRIQEYTQQVDIQQQSTPQVNSDNFTGGWKNATEAFKVLDNTVQQFKKVRDYNEVSQAEINLRNDIGQIEQEANNEQDPSKLPIYKSRIDDAITKHLDGVSDKLVRDQVAEKFNLTGYSSASKITNNFREKEINIGQANYLTKANDIANRIANAQSETDVNLANADFETNLKEAIKAGIYSPTDAVKLRLAHQNEVVDAKKTRVQFDIQNDNATKEEDSQVLKQLRDRNGVYNFLDEKSRLDLIQDSQRRVFQNNQTFKRDVEITKNQRFDDIFTKAYNNQLTLSDIDKEMEVPEEFGGIPKKQLLDIKEGIQKRVKSDLAVIVQDNDKAAEYLKFIDNFIDDNNDRQKAREYLATAYKDQYLSDKEAVFLNSIKREAEDIEYNLKYQESWNPLKSAIKSIGETLRGRKTATDKEAALAIKKLLSKVSDGEDINKARKDILREDAHKRNPSLLDIPDSGTEMMDSVGNIRMVLPDGSYR